jgi:hypothetical protein
MRSDISIIFVYFLKSIKEIFSMKLKMNVLTTGLLSLGILVAAPGAQAGAIHDANLFTDNTLPRNDDGSTGLVNLGFSANFFGSTFTQTFVNNNGNITFNSPLSTFTPFGLTTNSFPIIAPFFADVDTNNLASGVVQYGTDTLGGRNVFGVNWIDVGFFAGQVNPTNSFQLILTDRSDTGAGNFDIEFNYDRILWETGQASGGNSSGLGGISAAAGYTDGGTNDFEFAGSRVNGALLDGNPGGLIHGSRNSSIDGQYIFNVRNGQVAPSVPEPFSITMLGVGLAGLGAMRRKRNS